MNKPDRQTLLDNLKVSIESLLKRKTLVIEFEKADGTERVMRCTKYPPSTNVKISDSPKKTYTRNSKNLIVVWDVDKDDWRSIKVDSIKKVSEYK